MRGWRDSFSGLSPIIDEVIGGQKNIDVGQ